MKREKMNRRKRKRRIRWKIVGPFLVLLALIGYILYMLINPRIVPVVQPKTAVCDYNRTQAQNTLKTLTYTETLTIDEHLYYGETLNLYEDPFVLGTTDPLVGKTLILRNVCTGEELVFLLEATIDRQIPLDTLPEGFYELFVLENLTKKRLVAPDVLYDEFFTLRRHNGQGMDIDLMADPDLIESPYEDRPIFDQAYLFLRVMKADVPALIYDIVIDPSQNQRTNDEGYLKGDFNEALALHASAELLKEKLEAYGLRVLILRDADEILNRYGQGGRMDVAYTTRAKYYIALDLNVSTSLVDKGARVIYSYYTTNRFATAVLDGALLTDDLTIYGIGSPGNKPGVVRGKVIDFFDVNGDVRESGGKILGAGQYSDDAKLNEGFAAQNRFGLQAVLLDLGFITNPADYAIYTTQQDTLMENIAKGFAEYLQLSITP
jgi:N-acetylmuramoyl-L-alanine amidase